MLCDVLEVLVYVLALRVLYSLAHVAPLLCDCPLGFHVLTMRIENPAKC